MTSGGFPFWMLLPFPVLVLAIAVLPVAIPHRWEKRRFQIAVVLSCTLPVVWYELASGRAAQVQAGLRNYLAFVITLGALYVTSGGIQLEGEVEATPRNNLWFLSAGACLASIIGTTGASLLLIRPLLKTNRLREHRAHLVPFFILIVANVGGLLTPLGDPPLLVGYIEGVPFFWTLRLIPIWALYGATILSAFYLTDKRAYKKEQRRAPAADRVNGPRPVVRGRGNLVFLVAIIPAALLPAGVREASLLSITLASFLTTPKAVHAANAFSFGPILEVGIIFSGLFLCLHPVEHALVIVAPHLRVGRAWQLFWGAGVLSSVLDNAPTYSMFAALARGLPKHATALVAGIDPIRLAAISAGSVVMGATTYIGNGPNLMVKAVAESHRYAMPSFVRYFLFAFFTLLPAHLLVTAALWWLDR